MKIVSKHSWLTRNVWLLSGVSMFTDAASEMLYPIMPLYLRSLGYGVVALGVLEGAAEAVAGMNKVLFGHLSDKFGKRKSFVVAGYFLSAISKPLMGVAANIYGIFGARMLDRFGKGIRTAPRDALLSAESEPEVRGRVFGFHRSADTAGALIGPAVALVLLHFLGGNYTALFWIALIPGLMAVGLALLLEPEKKQVPSKKGLSLQEILVFWSKSSVSYKKLTVGLVAFALINSSNLFLILRAKEAGIADTTILLSYLLYNAVFIVFSYVMGLGADKHGFANMYIVGLVVFAGVYAVFGASWLSSSTLLIAFGVYGVFAAAEEGVAKAWISLHVPDTARATGIGLYLTLTSLGSLVASLLMGLIWNTWGSGYALSITAMLALGIMLYFVSVPIKAPEVHV